MLQTCSYLHEYIHCLWPIIDFMANVLTKILKIRWIIAVYDLVSLFVYHSSAFFMRVCKFTLPMSNVHIIFVCPSVCRISRTRKSLEIEPRNLAHVVFFIGDRFQNSSYKFNNFERSYVHLNMQENLRVLSIGAIFRLLRSDYSKTNFFAEKRISSICSAQKKIFNFYLKNDGTVLLILLFAGHS